MNMEQNIQEIPIEDIIPNRFQPRLTFNEEGLKELSESIKQHGIIQPLVVRKLGDKFEIIAGERRYKAASLAGLTKVPAIISNIDDNKSAEVALVENIQRRNLTAIEEAKSYKNLLDRGYLTQEQLADKMGVSQSTIANKLRLLNLAPEVQDALLNEKISERHARALLSLNTEEEQRKWLKRIIDERMPVRQLDIELKKLKGDSSNEDDGDIPLVNINPNINEIMNNAKDINTIKETHDINSFLKPQESFDSEPQKEPEFPKMPNKFFNFLEDEKTNMNVQEPINIFDKKIEDTNIINPIELLEESKEEIEPEEIVEINENPIPNEEIKSSPELQKFSFANFEGLIDPLDSIDKLDPEYEEKQEEKAGTDLKTTINEIRDTITNLEEKGIKIELEEADLEENYQITIKIKK